MHDAADSARAASELARQYERRFLSQLDYRNRVWQVLCASYFQQYVRSDAAILDLGSGYGQFINHIRARIKYAIDLNPISRTRVADDVAFFEQDCSVPWPIADASLDVVFTSNFIEHLPDKAALARTIREARRCLAVGGILMCLGPNIRYVPGAYWDFWDHHIALSDRTVRELLEISGFSTIRSIPRFLPYTMAEGPQVPTAFISAYLRLPLAWPIMGRQFFVVAQRQDTA